MKRGFFRNMAQQTSSRGRPKGSGIDDSELIGAISTMLRDNPEMRPTTAIKAIGVSNPSTIRRLRDKYNSQPSEDGGESDDDAPVRKRGGSARSKPPETATTGRAAYARLAGPKDPVRISRKLVDSPSETPDRGAIPTDSDAAISAALSSPDPLFAAISSSVMFGNFLVVQQAQVMRGLEANPFFRSWINIQILSAELLLRSSAAAVAGAGRGLRR